MSKKNIRSLGVISTQVTVNEPASFDAIEGLGELITSAPFTYKNFEAITFDSLRKVKPGKMLPSGDVTLEGISRTEWLLDGCYSVVVKGIARKRIHITVAQSTTQRGAVSASGDRAVAAGGSIGVAVTGNGNKF